MHNPLESYRRTQRELRREFDAFTRANCPACPTPCCRQPARILPTDILLAESTGWHSPLTQAAPNSRLNIIPLAPAESNDERDTGLPCEFLDETGCTFPTDLRPFGCTTYVCKYMYAHLDRPTLTRIKRLVRDMEDKHTILLRSVRSVRWNDEKNEDEE